MNTILICDDDKDIVSALDIYLTSEGYATVKAYDGQECLRLAEREPVDLILLDVMMPGLDGIRTTAKLRESCNVPIILLTAKSEDSDKILGLNIGADDYITKPFNLDILLLRIQKLLQWTQSNHEKFGKMEVSPSEITISSLDEQLIEKAIRIVEENMDNSEFSVEELSAQIGISRSGLYKKLMSITGKSPLEFMRILRLKRGKQLLEKSQLSISQIAYQVGLSPKQFAKYFKEEYGCLPSEYN